MTSAKRHPSRLRIWLLSFIGCLFVCSFLAWGIRELLFPPTNVCAIEKAEGQHLLHINQVYPTTENFELIGHAGGAAESVFIRDNFAFMKLGLELAVLDIQMPASPIRIGYSLLPGELIHVDDERQYAYINDTSYGSGLWRVNVSDPAHMSATHIYDPKYNITSIRLAGKEAYVTTRKCEYITSLIAGSIQTRCDDTLHRIDTDHPSSVTGCYQGLIGHIVTAFAQFTTPELINSPKTAQQGNYIYSAEDKDGLKIYDVSNPIQKVEVGSYPSTSEFIDVVVYKTNTLVTSLKCKNEAVHYCLYAFDVGIPEDPRDEGELAYKPIVVAEFDQYAVVREQFVSGNWPPGVEILDMSMPNSERRVFAPLEISEIVNMDFVGNRGYATTIDNKFLILDMSDVERPLVIANHDLGGNRLNYGLSVANGHAFIIVRDMGMRILDISDESKIYEPGLYGMDTIPVELLVKDKYAYIAEWYGTLQIVDVSNPRQPTLIHVFDAGDRINSMSIVENYLFMTAGNSGLQVIDISNPIAPYKVGSFITDTFTTGVDIRCPYIYVSDIENGLFILKSDLLAAENCDG